MITGIVVIYVAPNMIDPQARLLISFPAPVACASRAGANGVVAMVTYSSNSVSSFDSAAPTFFFREL